MVINPLKWFKKSKKPEAIPAFKLDDLAAYGGQMQQDIWQQSIWDGGKYPGGFGPTQLFQEDYWTLRARSEQLFTENLYAAGLIKRLITNEIGPGLMPESTPHESIIGVDEDSLTDWSETVETRFSLWGSNPQVCDYYGQLTWGGLNRVARMEALISGDCLVVNRENPAAKRPYVQLLSGKLVKTPSYQGVKGLKKGNTITQGVEQDKNKRVVAHWVQQTDGTFERLPAYGPRSGRKISWLVYGTEKRLNGVRGLPLLAVVLQSLKEIDRYRDSVQRKAVINSILAMFVKKTQDKPGTLPIQGGARRRDQATIDDSDGKTRKFNIAGQMPGLIIEELQHGEEPVLKGGEGTDVNFSTFETAILRAYAWSREIPPEILELSFSNNYSASQAAINEFKIYLNKVWSEWGEGFCTPIYNDWFISEVLLQSIDAAGFLEAWRDPMRYDVAQAWLSTQWYGSIKPSTDMLKQGKGSELLVKNGWSTNAREARVTTGTKFSQNVKRLKRENEQLAEALRPLLELKQEFGTAQVDTAAAALDNAVLQITDFIEDKAS